MARLLTTSRAHPDFVACYLGDFSFCNLLLRGFFVL
ncbi:hypothetical protein EF53_116 [Enterococcus phage 53]|nr:hypothetical protein EF53_116 [Enterococcus phage 53]